MSIQSEVVTRNQSLWAATAELPTFSPLRENLHTEICIVGAGISGLTTAYLLLKEGKSVVVLDDGPIGGGATEVTTAHLSTAIDARYVEIERLHGLDGARLTAESHSAAIDQIESIIQQENIDCDFERLNGYLFNSPDESVHLLDRELAAAQRAGLNQVVKLNHVPIPGVEMGACLVFPNQAQFHPLKYLAGLAEAIHRAGGRIFTKTHVSEIEGGSPAHIKAGGYAVTANAIVVATNSPVNDLVVMHTKQSPYMTYVIGVRIPLGTITKALFWDTEKPYHYVRLQSVQNHSTETNGQEPYDILIVGGEDHKTGQADNARERYLRLEQWARERFPQIGQVEFTWSGQFMQTIDGLAFIGHNPIDAKNVFIVTGDCGMGMTHGTIAGILLKDLILARENPWERLYDPSRKTMLAVGSFLNGMLEVATSYADWLTGGDVASVEEIAKDSGAVIRRGLTKVAIYRSPDGSRHECSAICPHLGGIVRWNSADQTWDCPCHGSRFDKMGTVMNGPANKNLTPIVQG